MLVYKIPPEPSRHRVAVWRRLKEAGAVYLQNSVSLLPESPASNRVLQSLTREIADAGGESFLLAAEGIDAAEEQKVMDRFNAERDEEYEEFLEQCTAFLAELDKETARQNFTFGELEENEGNFQRLATWLERIKGRDYFGASRALQAEQQLHECSDQMEVFTAQVFGAQQR